jgi:hypothetical protein
VGSLKIRIFNGDNAKVLENNVNRFIRDKNVISINQSESNGECTPKFNITITVLYEEYCRYDYLNARITKDSIDKMMHY